jgi:calmodulin
MSEKEIKTLLKDLDKDGDGTIDLQEFLDKVGKGTKRDAIHKALVKRSGIRNAFEKYDKDGNGFITSDEFRKVVEDKYGAKISGKEIKKLMKEADKNGDGKIDYEEFLKAFTYFKPST